MNNTEEIIYENNALKERINLLENEIINLKHKLNTYQSNSKKYYETHKEEIKIKNYKYKKINIK